MGSGTDEAVDSSDGGKLSRHLSYVSWNDRADELAARHGLANVGEIEDLFEQLDGLAIRDQGLPAGQAATRQRRQVAKAARNINREAETIIHAAKKLRSALAEFSSAVSVERDDGLSTWSASMLHQVFDIAPVDPAALDLPPELRALEAVGIPERQWLKGLRIMHDLASLPVRQRIRRGPVPDPVLVRAVLACRSFWESLGRSWKRRDLAETVFRDEAAGARREDLRGPAEKFLVDALTAADIKFTLPQLNGAWVEAVGRSREPNASERGVAGGSRR